MVYTEMHNITTLSGTLAYVSTNVPIFVPMLLLALGVIVFLATYFGQSRIRGYANPLACFSVSTYFVAVVCVVMSLMPNVVAPYVTLITITLAIIGTAVLLTINPD